MMHLTAHGPWLVATVMASLILSPSLARAQQALDTERPPEARASSTRRRNRDSIRPRWGIALGAFGGHLESEQVQRVCHLHHNTVTDYDEEQCEDSAPRHVRPGTGGPLVSAQAGIQSDYFGAFLLLRGIFGVATMAQPNGSITNPYIAQVLVLPFHLTIGLVAELTLFDFLQIGLGGSIDALVAADNNPWGDVGRNPAGIGPGFEIRLGAASGGGPYERRGFVATGFFHMSFVGVTTAALGGLEIGFESF